MIAARMSHGWPLQRAREFGRVAGIDADDRARHADPLLGALDRVDRLPERSIGRKIEAQRDGGKLRLIGDRQRRRRALQLGDGRDRHLRAADARHVEFRQHRRIALEFGQRFQHHAVLVRLTVDRGNLALAECVVQRVVDGLHRDAELTGTLAIDGDRCAQAAFLLLRRDVAEQRIALQLRNQLLRPVVQVGAIGAGQRVLILRPAEARRNLDVLHRLKEHPHPGHAGHALSSTARPPPRSDRCAGRAASA